jgi:hypothetical protein
MIPSRSHRAALVAALRRGEAKLAQEVAAERAGQCFGFPDGVEAATRRAWAMLLPQAIIKAALDPARRKGDPKK